MDESWVRLEEDLFKGVDIGHINSFELGPISIQDKTVVSCIPIFKLDAYLFYDNNQLYLSHQIWTESFWDSVLGGDSVGWVLIEE